MGALARFVDAFVPERKLNIGATIPTWDSGVPQFAQVAGQGQYWRFAREGYSANELVFACIEELCTSAAEPRLACYQRTANGAAEKIQDHPILDLFEQPNPFVDRFAFVATIILHLCLAGNAYLHKERSAAGKLTELWLLRPDRVRVIPDVQKHIGGYEYLLGDRQWVLPPQDVVHVRTRNAWDDYYGLPPMAVAARRTDTDSWCREFVRSYFTNAGVPAGLLTIQKQVTDAERGLIKNRFRGEYGGPAGWHSLMVLDNTEATFTAMGQSLGQRGLVLPELDEINEVRIAAVFGVPVELIGARISMLHGNRSTMAAAQTHFWDNTLIPLYRMLAAQLQMGVHDEAGFGGYDFLQFDLSDVQALQEDADALMTRATLGYEKGVLQRGEARKLVGQEATKDDDVYFLGRSSGLVRPDEVLVPGAAAALPEDVAPDPNAPLAVPAPSTNGTAKLSDWALELKAGASGLIVCLAIPPRLATSLTVPGGETADALHCTLAFLHESPPTRLIPRTRAVVQAVAAQHGPLVGTLGGVGRFSGALPTDPDVIYATLDVPGLEAFRTRLVAALQAAGIRAAQTHGFTPHVTLAYIPAYAPSPVTRLDPLQIVFEAVDVWAGDQHASYALAAPVLATNGVAH